METTVWKKQPAECLQSIYSLLSQRINPKNIYYNIQSTNNSRKTNNPTEKWAKVYSSVSGYLPGKHKALSSVLSTKKIKLKISITPALWEVKTEGLQIWTHLTNWWDCLGGKKSEAIAWCKGFNFDPQYCNQSN